MKNTRMKNILVVSVGTQTGVAMSEEIDAIFKAYAHTEFCFCHQILKKSEDCDIVVFSSEYSEALCSQYKRAGISYMSARRVINYTNIRGIIELEQGTQVLLVNDCEETASEAIDQLIEIGLNDIHYFPYYPGCKAYPEVLTAITPGEAAYVPAHIENIIDIGVRTLDIQTIYALMLLLGAEHLLCQSFVARYLKEIVHSSKSFLVSRRKAEQSEKLLETMIDSVDSGIAYVSSNSKIINSNKIFEDIFGKTKAELSGMEFEKLLSGQVLKLREGTSVIPVDGKPVLLGVKEVQTESSRAFLITADYGDKINRMNQRIKKDSLKGAGQKLYTFDNYFTWHEACRQMLLLAKKFTKTDGTILIQGESGTGKEILAQSIHHGSKRGENLFIPVNITAFTSSLIDSELFGYEDGAFTGAKKGGKAGIFELADKGTVFIDEIGDASMDFQVKLLRVLEGKCIRRVGGVEEIPVDVRIITATNKNLPRLIKENLFREDLYFRLNILPLCTIPLRERKNDILPLLRHFLSFYFNNEGIEKLLKGELVDFLTRYEWRGNVRELMNVAEYLGLTYEEERPSLDVLPAYMRNGESRGTCIRLGEEEYAVLHKIGENGSRSIGRNKLLKLLEEDGCEIGSGKIRSILKGLEDRGLIEQGGSGCVITEKGKSGLCSL